jgi:RNA polymerase sigma-70 factor (ECF subfamily)
MAGIDAAAVTRARTGDREAFRELVERHSRQIFRLAYRMTGNEEDAEDVVQETFLRAYKSLTKFEGQAEFGTWLHRIAANCAIDVLRRREPATASFPIEAVEEAGSSVETGAAFGGPERDLFAADVRRKLAASLEALTPMERAAFVLRHFEGKPVAEIARALDIRLGAAKNCVFRAVSKLRRELTVLGAETP